MDDLKEAMQLAVLQENSEAASALRSLLLGLCQQCAISLQKANSYQELILDELDAHRGNTAYLDKAQKELSAIQTLVAQILQELPPITGERLHFSRLTQAVLEHYQKKHPLAPKIQANLDQTAFIAADPFEAQELILHLLEGLDRLRQQEGETGRAPAHAWQVVLENRTFSRQEASFLRLRDEGDYSLLHLLPAGAAPQEDPRQLKPFSQCLEEAGATDLPLLATLQWCGSAAHNAASLFFDSLHPRESAILVFPRLPDDLKNHTNTSPYRWQNTQSPKTILLVDDEDMIWDVLSDMLQDLGYQVLLAGDGQEAVEIYRSNPHAIDLVILDMLMPNMGGRETFFMLKELDPKVRVLASSGYVSQEEIQDVMDSGAAGFLRKPYHISDLAKKIKEILGND
ncbi:MAG: response regulator [Oligosphaeraceae bacterium]